MCSQSDILLGTSVDIFSRGHLWTYNHSFPYHVWHWRCFIVLVLKQSHVTSITICHNDLLTINVICYIPRLVLPGFVPNCKPCVVFLQMHSSFSRHSERSVAFSQSFHDQISGALGGTEKYHLVKDDENDKYRLLKDDSNVQAYECRICRKVYRHHSSFCRHWNTHKLPEDNSRSLGQQSSSL